MCTVTIVPRQDGFRLACNRDERRDRPPAAAPSVHTIDGIEATFPTDPEGGGTWIGVNSAGLAVVLLNRTDDPSRTCAAEPRVSRGTIIPPLLGCRSLGAAMGAARRVNPARFDPFRLILVQGTTCASVSSNGAALSATSHSFDAPLMFTSSSLGDEAVAAPRQILFEQQVLSGGDERAWLEGQRRFHHHRWADRPQLSVMMSRVDARTVSVTIVEVCESLVTLRYHPVGNGGGRLIALGRAA